ncbi:hypothetical protein CSC94_07970 [Zhengella mangrovi]|uniref:Uncharacterized protein n=1 Tax=Zhengella mangrovi TaxID=1982044 RepID=A0A2G1QQ15_9HYPH|nr:hypothetical protein [Zhengella mangrovi]PHP67626.1 hypothetical protein CSC94_07970 [Zhengella mangrovi]
MGDGFTTVIDRLTAVVMLLSIGSAVWASSSDISLASRLAGIGVASLFLCLPYGLLWFVARRFRSPVPRWLAIGAMVLIFAFWAWIFLETYIFPSQPDAQDALIFVAAPMYMIAAAVLAAIVLRIADGRSTTPPPAP